MSFIVNVWKCWCVLLVIVYVEWNEVIVWCFNWLCGYCVLIIVLGVVCVCEVFMCECEVLNVCV